MDDFTDWFRISVGTVPLLFTPCVSLTGNTYVSRDRLHDGISKGCFSTTKIRYLSIYISLSHTGTRTRHTAHGTRHTHTHTHTHTPSHTHTDTQTHTHTHTPGIDYIGTYRSDQSTARQTACRTDVTEYSNYCDDCGGH